MSVIPIPPFYSQDGSLNIVQGEAYINWLETHQATTIMTTAGTSQFNFLTNTEIYDLNIIAASSGLKSILGLPQLSTGELLNSVKDFKHYERINPDVNLMILYPDRFYDKDPLTTHFYRIRDLTSNPLYIHAMHMRGGRGGTWNYTSDILCELFEAGIVGGIKEEHSSLQDSFDFVKDLPEQMDVIVAGGSMRRHQFLKNAKSSCTFLAGIGNIFPCIELAYLEGQTEMPLKLETRLFDTFKKYGWHPSLRVGLSYSGFYTHDRSPWPQRTERMCDDIYNTLLDIDKAWIEYEQNL